MDYGNTWEDISANIPCGPINVVREDPKNKNVLYVGTDIGAYVSIDGGKAWNVLAKDFPSTFVHDMVIHPREDILLAATHGRGMWAMDVRYIQSLTEENLAKGVYFYDVEDVKLPQRRRGWFRAAAPLVKITYFLKSAQDVKLVVLDESDKVVKELEAPGDAGLQFVEWDLKKETAEKEKKEEESQPDFVEPGKYKIRLSTSVGNFEKEFKILKAGD